MGIGTKIVIRNSGYAVNINNQLYVSCLVGALLFVVCEFVIYLFHCTTFNMLPLSFEIACCEKQADSVNMVLHVFIYSRHK
jgi:hypothetical protein